MLLIVELIFLAVGLWAIIAGKVPDSVLRLLFGKGEYGLTPTQTRLLGVLLASPFPVVILVSAVFTLIFGDKATGYSLIFEIIYIVSVAIITTIVARRLKSSQITSIGNQSSTNEQIPQGQRSYGTRLLILAGIAFLSCVTVTGGGTLIMTIVSGIRYGATWTGNFWSDIFPFIALIGVTGLGILGVIKLYRLYRS